MATGESNNKEQIEKLISLIKDNEDEKVKKMRGELITPYIITLEICKQIAKDKGLNVINKNNPRNGPELNNFHYVFREGKTIKPAQLADLNTIIDWRHPGAHDAEIKDIDPEVEDHAKKAYQRFKKWFFEDYLKDEYTKSNIESKSEEQKNNTTQTRTPINNSSPPVDRITSIRDQNSHKKSPILKYLFIALGISGLIAIVYSVMNQSETPSGATTQLNQAEFHTADTNTITDNPVTSSNSAQQDIRAIVTDLLNNYYANLLDHNFNALPYLADEITEYKTLEDNQLRMNLDTLDVLNLYLKKGDQINPEFLINNEQLVPVGEANGLSKWQYTCDYADFKRGAIPGETHKVIIDVTINSDNKITALKESEVNEK